MEGFEWNLAQLFFTLVDIAGKVFEVRGEVNSRKQLITYSILGVCKYGTEWLAYNVLMCVKKLLTHYRGAVQWTTKMKPNNLVITNDVNVVLASDAYILTVLGRAYLLLAKSSSEPRWLLLQICGILEFLSTVTWYCCYGNHFAIFAKRSAIGQSQLNSAQRWKTDAKQAQSASISVSEI